CVTANTNTRSQNSSSGLVRRSCSNGWVSVAAISVTKKVWQRVVWLDGLGRPTGLKGLAPVLKLDPRQGAAVVVVPAHDSHPRPPGTGGQLVAPVPVSGPRLRALGLTSPRLHELSVFGHRSGQIGRGPLVLQEACLQVRLQDQ